MVGQGKGKRRRGEEKEKKGQGSVGWIANATRPDGYRRAVERLTEGGGGVFTIGHPNHSIARFIELLKGASITAVADVRSSPFSRHNPQFNREALKAELKRSGIRYEFLGHELGARSKDPAVYENGRVRYDRLAATELFAEGLTRVRIGAKHYRIALMCAEKEPLDCHRTVLVARALAEKGLEVSHILADGSVEPHAATVERLLSITGETATLFQTKSDAVDKAYRRRGEEIAFVDETKDEGAAERQGP